MSSTKDRAGYGKPPKHTRFKKGTSGNPRGRPPGAMGFSQWVERELRQTAEITLNGRKRRASHSEILAIRLVSMAMSGDLRAMKTLLELHPSLKRDLPVRFTLDIGKVSPPGTQGGDSVVPAD